MGKLLILVLDCRSSLAYLRDGSAASLVVPGGGLVDAHGAGGTGHSCEGTCARDRNNRLSGVVTVCDNERFDARWFR